jgi:RNA polymerase sigma factor (sigma-70 family)
MLVPGRQGMRQRKTDHRESLYEMARVIANSKAGGRYYREDLISDAYLAVAEGAATRSDIENAIRRSLRGEWRREDRHASLELADSLMHDGAPERARFDLWGALRSLDERQRAVVVLTFWGGLTQEEISSELGIRRRTVGFILEQSLEAIKIFLTNIAKTQGQNAVGI